MPPSIATEARWIGSSSRTSASKVLRGGREGDVGTSAGAGAGVMAC